MHYSKASGPKSLQPSELSDPSKTLVSLSAMDDGNPGKNYEQQPHTRREDVGDTRFMKLHHLEKQSRENRDLLRFIYQTTAKGHGKGFPDWLTSWKQCRVASVNCDANCLEGRSYKESFSS